MTTDRTTATTRKKTTMKRTGPKRALAAAATVALLAVTGCSTDTPPEAAPGDDDTARVQVPLSSPTGPQGERTGGIDDTETLAPGDDPADPTPGSGAPVTDPPAVPASYDLELPVDLDTLGEVASEAAEFAGLYASYDYRVDPAVRMKDLGRYVAKEHLVNLQDAVPTGPLADSYRTDQVVTTARVVDVALNMLTPDSALFAVHVETSTAIRGEVSEIEMEYAVTMRKGHRSWAVENLTSAVGGSGGHQH